MSSPIRPQYTRYRASPRVLRPRARGEREQALERLGDGALVGPAGAPPSGGRGRRRMPRPARRPGWRGRVTPKRVILGFIGLVGGWILLSIVLFLISSLVEEQGPTGDVSHVLHHTGALLFSANNILVIGSDARPAGSHEPGASTVGQPSRSDTLMLLRTGGGHSGKLSIPRDTLVDIPGHGPQKINAAYYFGGPALSIETVEALTGIPIDHVIEINFTTFPDLINAMGGITYTGSCVFARVDGGASQGGVTLRLKAGTHHLNGKQALALSRVRHNTCAPNENDLTRELRQQKVILAMKSAVLSLNGFLHLPWIAWDTPRAIRSDMGGPTLLEVFAALGVGGTGQSQILQPTGAETLPGTGDVLTITPAAAHADAKKFLSG